MREIVIEKNEAGQRLDKFLAKYMNEASKSFFYKMMRKKNITLNGKKCEGNEKLAEGDVVKLFLAEDTIEKFSSVQVQEVKKVDLDILYEDDEIILVNKPAGMLSQKAKETDESLVEYLIDYLLGSGKLTESGLRAFRPSVCNRLDRNTSGIVAAGKSLAGLQMLSGVFKDRSIHKYYKCLVSGVIRDVKTVDGWLLKDEKKNQVRILTEADRDGRKVYAAQGDTSDRTFPSDPRPFSVSWTSDRGGFQVRRSFEGEPLRADCEVSAFTFLPSGVSEACGTVCLSFREGI